MPDAVAVEIDLLGGRVVFETLRHGRAVEKGVNAVLVAVGDQLFTDFSHDIVRRHAASGKLLHIFRRLKQDKAVALQIYLRGDFAQAAHGLVHIDVPQRADFAARLAPRNEQTERRRAQQMQHIVDAHDRLHAVQLKHIGAAERHHQHGQAVIGEHIEHDREREERKAQDNAVRLRRVHDVHIHGQREPEYGKDKAEHVPRACNVPVLPQEIAAGAPQPRAEHNAGEIEQHERHGRLVHRAAQHQYQIERENAESAVHADGTQIVARDFFHVPRNILICVAEIVPRRDFPGQMLERCCFSFLFHLPIPLTNISLYIV